MINTDINVALLIGEATEYDKKQALEEKKPKSWCKSVSAFANGIGGKLVWGIADDDTLVGLADAKGDAEKISEAIKSHLDPIPDFKLSFARCEDITVLRATYYKRTKRSFENSDYESFGIVNEKGELTNAGALLADYSPVRHSRLFCTRWNGLDKANGVMDALDDEEYSGSLVTLLQSGLDFVRRNSRKAWHKTHDSRLEYPEYPERAVEEGLVNELLCKHLHKQAYVKFYIMSSFVTNYAKIA